MISRLLSKLRFGRSSAETISFEDLRRSLPRNPVIVEAGAYDGGDTADMSGFWPGGHIHAFEPVPELFEKLKAKTAGLRNVTCYPLALAGSTGAATMHVSEGPVGAASSSLLSPKDHLIDHPDIRFPRELPVETITLDDWSRRYAVGRVDFLWLDVQGSELTVLRAAPVLLGSVAAIYLEVSLKETYEGVPRYPEVRRWLEAQGFRLKIELLPWPDMGNVLFVRAK